MNHVLKCLAAALLTALTVLVLQASCALIQFQATMDHVVAEIHFQSMATLRTQDTLRETLVGLERDVDQFRMDTTKALASFLEMSDYHLTQANQTLALTARELEGNLHQTNASIERTSEAVERVAEGTVDVENQISDGLSQFLNCERNPACLYSRWAAGSKAFIDTLGIIDKATPPLAEAALKNAQNMAKITETISKPRGWLGKTWEALKLGAIVLSRAIF